MSKYKLHVYGMFQRIMVIVISNKHVNMRFCNDARNRKRPIEAFWKEEAECSGNSRDLQPLFLARSPI